MLDINGLKTFKISNGALKGETLPRRLKFFAWGDNKSTDGSFRAGEKTSAELASNQRKFGFERVAIDFNHCSVPGTDTYKDLLKVGQPPLIFGYGRVEAAPGDGIYLEDIIWTPLGVQHARNFEDLSPAIQDEEGEVTLVHSVALTPNGKVEGLEFFSSNLTADSADSADFKSKNTNLSGPTSAATTETQAKAFMTIKIFTAALGLPDTADEKAVTEALKERLNTAGVLPNAATEIKTLSAQIAALTKRLDDGAKADTEAQRNLIITTLAAEGKSPRREDGAAYSREQLLALDVPTLKLLQANTPATVPLSARGMTSRLDGHRQYVSKDSQGNVSVDLAGIFDSENQKNGQGTPGNS